MELPDLYKLLFQATMGSEHATGDRAMADEWMRREVAGLGPGPAEPLVDTLGAPGRFARIHLRPFIARRGIVDSLEAAFVSTGRVAPADTAALGCAMAVANRLARQDSLPWKAGRVSAYLAGRAAAGYPAGDHSAAFERLYHPAYRVVARVLLPRALASEAP
jgi:hypothetical protein